MRSNVRSTPQLPRLSHQTGNASADGVPFQDWIIGHFVPPELGERSTQHIEVKWGVHDAGEGEHEWSVNKTATTVSILLRGKDRIAFPDREVVLEREGDYAIWGPGVPHRWRAIEPSVVVTVRWPSVSNDVIRLSDTELTAYLNDLSFTG
jgi:hypothetical protein